MGGCQSGPDELLPKQAFSPSVYVDEYIVGVGDTLAINVWRNPELSTSVPVRPDGRISAPLVGDVEASGFTPEQVAENITESLREFIRDPQVTVIVTGINNADYVSRVRITGAVRSPQSIPHQAGITVLDLVLAAGGPNEFAITDHATLYRGGKAYRIQLADILERGKLETNYELLPGDVITLSERSF